MRKYYGLIFLLLCVYLLLEAAVISKGFYSISADDSGRSILAYNLVNGIMPEDLDWLPLHSLINAGALLVFNDLFWVPRIVSILFGILSVIAMSQLSYELFQNTKVVILTAFFSVFYPLRIMFSATPLTEIMFAFFIIESFALFIKWFRQKEDKHLYLSALFLTLSGGVRYEGWIISFAMFITILILFRKDMSAAHAKKIILTAIILSIIPVLWMTIHWQQYGNPLYFFSGPQNLYQKLTGNSILLRLKYNFVTNFIFQVLFFFTFPGLLLLVKKSGKEIMLRQFLYIWGISIVIVSALSVGGYGNPSHAFWRIPFIWTYLLIPFLSYVLYIFTEKNVFTTKIRWLIILLPLPLFYLMQTYFLTGNSPFTKADKQAGEFLGAQIAKNPESNILIETTDWNYLHVEVASGHPDKFKYDIQGSLIRPHNFSIINSQDSFTAFVKSNNINYVAVFDETSRKKIAGMGLVKLKTFSGWVIYEIN